MGRRFRYARNAVLFAVPAAIAVSSAPACREPTQVTVQLRTTGGLTCAALKGVAIVVAGSPERAEEKLGLGSLSAEVPRGRCGSDPTLIGTLVVTPSGGAAAVVVRARISDEPNATCRAPDYKGCIVARRAFAFIEHASKVLPISLEASCADVPCDVVTSCRTGRCVSSSAECSEGNDTCASAAEPGGGTTLSDGAVLEDGAIPDVVASDGAMPDSATDAPVVVDAGRDANPALWGNDCPSMPPVDCATKVPMQQCCYMAGFFCMQPCMFAMGCLGRKYCGGMYCCGAPNPNPVPNTACVAHDDCAFASNHFICTTDADCPDELPKCNGTYKQEASGKVSECTAN